MSANQFAQLAVEIKNAVDKAYEAGQQDIIEKLLPALTTIAAQSSGKVASTDRADCMAALANAAIRGLK